MEQTAVQWLIDQIMLPENYNNMRLGGKKKLFELVEQAKQMEEEQLIQKYGEGYDEGLYDGENK